MRGCSCTDAAIGESISPQRCDALAACAKGSTTSHGLLMRRWPNRAFGGNYVQTVVPTLSSATTSASDSEPFSLEALGTITLPDGAAAADEQRWLITCESRGGSLFLWLDDHLVCEAGNNQPRWNPFRLEAVVPFNHTLRAARSGQTSYFLRATFVQQPSTATLAGRPFFSLLWQRAASAPVYIWGKNSWTSAGSLVPEVVPSRFLTTFVPPAQHARLTVQRELLHGYWGTWNERSVTSHVILPFGVELRIGLCSLRAPAASCALEGLKSMVDSGSIRLGSHAYDHAYTQLHWAAAGVNISLETAQRGRWGAFLVLARIVGETSPGALSDAALVVSVALTGGDGAGHNLPGRVRKSCACPVHAAWACHPVSSCGLWHVVCMCMRRGHATLSRHAVCGT